MKKLFFLFTLSLLLVSVAWGQGLEDFTNSNATASYLDGTFIGNDEITWSYGHSRNEGDYPIDGKGLMLRRASDSYLEATIPGGIATFSFEYRKAFTGTAARQLEVYVNNVSVGTTDEFGTTEPDSTVYTYSISDINTPGDVTVKIKNVGTTTQNRQTVLDNISWTGYASSTPTISVNPTSLTGFTYVYGNGPSVAQSFAVTGSNLTGNLSVSSVGTNYVVSATESGTYGTSLSLTQSGGSVSATVYVKLNSGLAIGNYNSQDITVSGGGATSQTVSCSGTVSSPPPPNAPTASSATSVANTSFTANWGSVSGATGYKLDVYTLESGGNASDLFISEYIEGGSNNKYIELYNGTGASVDLSNYELRQYNNGSPTVSYTLPLSGTLADGATYVIANSSGTIYANPDLTNNTVMGFNGDDALELYRTDTSTTVDIFGCIGEDPGSAWSSGSHSTANKTLVRKSTVMGGVTTSPSSGFPTLETEWDVYAQDTSTYLGSHTFSGGLTKAYVSGYQDLSVSGTSQSVTGLTQNTTYYYVVRALNTYGTSDDSNEIEVTTTTSSPLITLSTDTLSDFYYVLGYGPSATQSFTVSGVNLSGPISISAPANFKISSNELMWGGSVNLNPVGSTVAEKIIYVRMDSGLSGGTYSGDITISSSGVANQSIALSGSVTVPSAPVANLFFSEYIEGSSNNKALEVYNASGADVNLADYKLVLYSNGAATPGNTLQMDGTLAAGAVYVVANDGSNQAILDLADVTSTVTYYNGNDAVALVYVPDESIIDQIGEIGVDPGSAWPVAGVPEATVEHTLIRKPTVATGNTDWALQQGTNAEDSEWIVMPQDYIANLGTHTYNPGAQYAEMPVFDPPAGTYFSSVSVTITSTTAGAAIRYTTDGTDPTATTGTLYSGPVSISSTTTLKAIAYAGGYEPSLVNTADYTITSSTQVADIATLRAQTTGSNVYTLTGEAILTFQQSSRNQKYIQDATGAILIDDNAGNITTTYNLYDGITGISGTLTLYNNLLQFVPVADPGEATSSNNVVEPEVRTLASLSAVDQAKLIKVMNVAITGAATFPSYVENLTATDPTASLTLRTFPGADYAGTAIPTDPVNLTCLVGQYSDTMQIGHRFLSDIEEIGGQLASPVVDLSLMDNMLYLDWNAVSGASSYRVEAADDPYAATFSVLGTTTDPGMLITPSSAKKFYRVIALP